jgi:hypothetical protein
MVNELPEIAAAQSIVGQTSAMLDRAPSFRQLAPSVQASIMHDLGAIQQALKRPEANRGNRAYDAYALTLEPPPTAAYDPYALALETPNDLARRRAMSRRSPGGEANAEGAPEPDKVPGPRVAATETLAQRAGALSDEVDFPAFVAGLVHGTFDAIVDANIRQMEAFADLVSSVAKDVDQFTRENITPNQVRDWLAQRYPNDLVLELPSGPNGGSPLLRRRPTAGQGEDEAEQAPAWLADFGMEGEPLTDELIEGTLIQVARRSVGEQRLQMLATMVLMGMSRVNIKDGSISARVRFRAAARDRAKVDYAVTQDPGQANWGARGSSTYAQHATMVSTVGVNVQAETELKAELFGEVKINFASETLPLERFIDSALMTLLQRNARPIAPAGPAQTRAAPPAEQTVVEAEQP